jgi:hypothetical protein
MPFECPKTIEVVPTAELFSINFPININGAESNNVNYSTNPITLSTKPIKYDILQINKGINDPISKHWPLIETWKSKNVTKKIKILGKKYDIKIPVWKPTQALDEIYTKKVSEKLTFFTIPSFKFQLEQNLALSGHVDCDFTLSVESKGACLLSTETANAINGFYKQFHNSNINILTMPSQDRTNYIQNMVTDPNFLASAFAATAASILAFLMRDGLCASFRVNKASGKINWDLNKFYIEFGDLKIDIPPFTIELDFPDILKDPVTGQEHPVTVTGNPETGLTVIVQLLEVPDGDFFGLMLTGLQNTLNIAKQATGSDYDGDYVKALEDILAQLHDADDTVTKWIQQYLGITFDITFSFVYCPAGMESEPPSPFLIEVELELTINPYKILDDLFDAAEVIENTMETFENELLKAVEDIGPSFAHPIEHMIQGALNTLNAELKSATDSAQKLIDNKYINKDYTVTLAAYIPIEPPP